MTLEFPPRCLLQGNMISTDGASAMFRSWTSCALSLCFALFAVADSISAVADDVVTFEPHADGISVKIRGDEFTVFHHGPSLPKPYFWPVRGSGGAILTRPVEPGEKDHPHHRGIWLAVDEVNEIKFWAERGQITTRKVESKAGNPGTITVTNEWLRPDGVVVLNEQTTISIDADRLMSFDIVIAPPTGKTARFDDTKEGFFGIRIAQSMREKEGGIVVNSEGKKTTQECWGQHARWVDYTGKVDGKDYGVALMDHPGNFRPSRYHVRDYGLFSMSPFGEGAYQNDIGKARPVTLDESMPSLRIRYGLYVHNGDSVEGHVTEAFDRFIDLTK